MADDRTITAGAARRLSDVPPRVLLSPADYADLMRELDELRSRHCSELAQRLRDARDFGSPGDDDDRLAVFEDAAFEQARIAQLERLAESASVVAPGAGIISEGAGLGSTVRVADEAGETMEYELVGRRGADSKPRQVSLASPVGAALIGARPGDVVRVAPPSGRDRVLHVLAVTGGLLAAENAPPRSMVRAA